MLATLMCPPDFYFYSEHLYPNHFYDMDNRYIYTAIKYLVENNAKNIDPISIHEALKSQPATAAHAEELTVEMLYSFVEQSETLVRHTVEDYKTYVDNILDASFRRDALKILKDCEKLCMEGCDDIEHKIYSEIDKIMVEYSMNDDIPLYKDMIDDCWSEIESRQSSGYAGIPFKFSALNDFATIERGELFIFGAEQKQGKSMMLLNCAVDLLKKGYKVLYLDSELNTRLFTARILAHLSGIEYKRLTAGCYSEEEKAKIDEWREWLKTRDFTHIYIPTFDQQSIYTTIKKVEHTQGIDVLIVDYFKGRGEGDAFDSYQELGRFVDMIKNQVCGKMNIAGIGAAQATASGKLADSAKIARNASTIAMITDKSPDEIETDGVECGNKKLRIVVNRNGAQHASDEYIDLRFDGNHILYEQAKQHIPQTPF